jgi:NAD(P)-dependent dehydrogenase (short-subunit alcohol dehydrogenase family)
MACPRREARAGARSPAARAACSATTGSHGAGVRKTPFISGALADRPSAQGTAVLAAASAAREAFARGLALELAPLRVNTLAPGPIDTPLLARILGAHRDAYGAALSERLPQGRLGTADEAGAAVVFLMRNGFVNGETLHVDGGARLV